jgi:hypothetical protein
LFELRSPHPPKLILLVKCGVQGIPPDEKELADMDIQSPANDKNTKEEVDEPGVETEHKGKFFIQLAIGELPDSLFGEVSGGKGVCIAVYYKGESGFSLAGHSELVKMPEYVNVNDGTKDQYKSMIFGKNFICDRPPKQQEAEYKFSLFNTKSEDFSLVEKEAGSLVGSLSCDIAEIYYGDDKKRQMNFVSAGGQEMDLKLDIVTKKPRVQGTPSRFSLLINCNGLPCSDEFGGQCNPKVVLYVLDGNTPKHREVSMTEALMDHPDPSFKTPIIVDSFANMDRDLKFVIHDSKAYEVDKLNSLIAFASVKLSHFLQLKAESPDSVVLLPLVDKRGKELEGHMLISAEEIEIPDENIAADSKRNKLGMIVKVSNIMKDWTVDDGKHPMLVLYKKSPSSGDFDYVGQSERIPGEHSPYYRKLFILDDLFTMPNDKLAHVYRLDLHNIDSDNKADISPTTCLSSSEFDITQLTTVNEEPLFKDMNSGTKSFFFYNSQTEVIASFEPRTIELGLVSKADIWAVLSGVPQEMSKEADICVALYCRDRYVGGFELVATAHTPGAAFISDGNKFEFYSNLNLQRFSCCDRQMRFVAYKLQSSISPLTDANIIGECVFSLNELLLSPLDGLEWSLYTKEAKAGAEKKPTNMKVELHKIARVDPNAAAVAAAASTVRPRQFQSPSRKNESENRVNDLKVDTAPNDRPVDIAPNDRPVDIVPNDQPVDKAPNDQPVDKAPNDQPVASPVEQVAPVASPVEQVAPVASPVEQVPPVESPVEQVPPVESPVEQVAPVESPVEVPV